MLMSYLLNLILLTHLGCLGQRVHVAAPHHLQLRGCCRLILGVMLLLHSSRRLAQQAAAQPPSLPQQVPFAVRLAFKILTSILSLSLNAEHMITPDSCAAAALQNILQPALQQAARPGRHMSFKMLEAAVYQSYAQAPALLPGREWLYAGPNHDSDGSYCSNDNCMAYLPCPVYT